MKTSLTTAAVVLLLSGCVIGDAPEEAAPAPLEPTFAAASPSSPASPGDAAASPDAGPSDAQSDLASQTSPTASAAPTPVETAPGAASTAPPPSGEEPVEPEVLRARITDPRGDTTASIEREPSWSDLVGAELQRDRGAFSLWVDLDGGAPTGSGSADHTMNVASFYDLDGDGRIDVEVWVNLADGGWDSALYDNRDGSAAFSDDDPVEVRVEGERLRIDFPAGVLDGSSSFRWSIASEWGRYEQLGTALTVRDDAPDDDRPASFPG